MAAYVDSTGVTNLTADIKALADASYVNGVAYDSTNHKLTKTIGSSTTDVLTIATLKTEIGTASSSQAGLMSTTDKAKLDSTLGFTLIGQI